jgi:hypothetical protein
MSINTENHNLKYFLTHIFEVNNNLYIKKKL